MKMNLSTLKQQTQEFILRLFVESASDAASTPSRTQYFTGSRCGTYCRLH